MHDHLTRVLGEAATQGTLIAGFHMTFPSVGYAERHGTGFRWVPASYELWA